MAKRTLDKFGVKQHNSGVSMMGQPKPKNRFRVMLFGFGYELIWNDETSAITIQTDSVSKPKVSFNAQEMHNFDGVASYSGKKRWGEIELAVKDTVDNGPITAVMHTLQKQTDFHRRLAPRGSDDGYKFEMWIQTLSGEEELEDWLEKGMAFADKYLFGNEDAPSSPGFFAGTLDTWVCQGCMVTEYNFGELDYSDSNYNTINLTIKPDHCFMLDDKGQPMSGDGMSMLDTAKAVSGGIGSVANKIKAVKADGIKGLF